MAGTIRRLLPALSSRTPTGVGRLSRQERPYTRAVRLLFIAAFLLAAACEAGPPPATPPITPGTSGSPREVNLIARDYSFQPPTLDLAPGETVVLHVINGGLVTHEAILGDDRVQDAWEAAEAPHGDPPPGPTPVVSVPPDVAGVRIVVRSGERVDLQWTVPAGRGRLRMDRWLPHRRALGQGHADSRALGGAEPVARRHRGSTGVLEVPVVRSPSRTGWVSTSKPRGGTHDLCDRRAVYRRA